MQLTKNSDGNVKVVCRFRPLNQKQKQLAIQTIHQVYEKKTVKIKDPKIEAPIVFNLDAIFDLNSNQQQVYEISGKPVVQSVLEGFNGTIFAYGQTSSGKTHTMQGYNLDNPVNRGIIPRMIDQVFSAIAKSPQNIQFRLKVSIVQLYMQKVRDLLDISKQDLKIRSHNKKGIYIQDVTQNYVSTQNQLYALMQIGNKNRASCSTNMNQRSSRSHMIFLITIYQNNLIDMSAKSGKLFLVDLAGSEKISKTGAEGKVLDEAKKINLSLTTLGKVIKALTEGKGAQHIPYRQSKLTRILQQSLGGNSKTTLIITCSPHPTNLQQTISTLRFGMSAKKITNKAKINRELTVGEVQALLQKSEKQLAKKNLLIQILQNYIKNDLKRELPNYSAKNQQPLKSEIAEINQVSEINLQEQYKQDISRQNQVPNKQIDERIKVLQLQLHSSKLNLQIETQKLNSLRIQYNLLHTSTIQLQNQNNILKQQYNILKLDMQNRQQARKQDIELQNDQKNIVKLMLNQIIQLIKNQDMKNDIIQQLKNKKWYKQIENINVNSFFQQEKQKIMKDLQSKIEKLNQLEKSLQQQTKKSKIQIQQSNNQSQQAYNQQRYIELEKKLQDLHSNYYQMVSLQSTWKAQCQIYQRKLNRKCKQVKQLEQMVNQLRSQIENYKRKQQSDAISLIKVSGTRLVKPIRGGNRLLQYS